jgi:signal transduction histidine kinase/CheY-like chemotaxis protein
VSSTKQVNGVAKKSGVDQLAKLEKKLVEREAYIDELKRTVDEARAGGRAKSELLMSMGHEFRNPLNGIMGMTNLVLETELSATQRQHLEMASSSAERLLEVVNDLVDFCLLESGKLELAREDFDLGEALDCDFYLMKWSAIQKNIDFTYQIDDDVPGRLNGDPDRLVQVVSSLVDNAIKYTEQGSVSLLLSYLGTDGQGRALLKFSVTDTGIGLTENQQRAIGERLSQSQAPPPSTFWGGGLGLSVAAQIVHLAEGEIGLESRPGDGTTFWFTWPFAHAADAAVESVGSEQQKSPAAALFRFDEKRVLLAEDEPIGRILIETLLDQAGLQVTAVDNGRLAAEEAASGAYQAVLMDVEMPIMDGLEATRKIRQYERSRGGHVPIIALTAHAMPGDREICLQAGMDDYLTKPVAKEKLYDMLTRYLTSTVLVVDSDPQSRRHLVEFLVESGWRVSLAETPRSAMYEASLGHFDLVLLDMREEMGDLSETPRLIRQLEQYSGRRSLILGLGSNIASEARLFTYRKSGVDEFLRHPLDFDDLRTRIEEHQAVLHTRLVSG